MSEQATTKTPAVPTGDISADLYELTAYMASLGHEASHGVLGGEWGYGCDYSGPVFEMHPFWWGDCECGHEARETAWTAEHPHAEGCYQTALEAQDWERPAELAAAWGLPEFGCCVHCTCSYQADFREWSRTHGHDPACPEVRPNFRHHGSGVEVRWYKYIGRGMEYAPQKPDHKQWRRVFTECVASLGTP